MEKPKSILLREVKLYWASIKEPKNIDGKLKYLADITNLTKEQATELHNAGLKIRKGEELETPQPEKGLFITSKSGIQPKVKNASNQTLAGDAIPDIGNGTVANVIVKPYPWTYQGKSGMGAGLNGIQVLDLVEFSKDDDLFTEEPDYVKPGVETVEDDVPF